MPLNFNKLFNVHIKLKLVQFCAKRSSSLGAGVFFTRRLVLVLVNCSSFAHVTDYRLHLNLNELTLNTMSSFWGWVGFTALSCRNSCRLHSSDVSVSHVTSSTPILWCFQAQRNIFICLVWNHTVSSFCLYFFFFLNWDMFCSRWLKVYEHQASYHICPDCSEFNVFGNT